MPEPLLIMGGLLILAIVTLLLREQIDDWADRICPPFVKPWQNMGVRIVLWMTALLIISGLTFTFGDRTLFLR